MSYDAQKVTYQEVAIFDRPALFTECRIDRTTVPEGVYRYELRHGDEDWGEPIELSRSLMVNFYGTVLTREPFQLPIDGWIPMENDSLSFQDGGATPLRNFSRNIPPVIRRSLTFTASMSLRCTLSISPAARNRTSLRAVWDTCVVILAAASSFTQHGGPTSKTH